MGRKGMSPLLMGVAALQVATVQAQLPGIPLPTTLVGQITSVVGGATSVVGEVTSVVGGATGIVTSVVGDVTSVVGDVTSVIGSVTGIVTSVVGDVTSIVGDVTSVVGDVTSVIGGITTLIPITTVTPTTVSTFTPITTTTTISSTTTEVTTLSPTSTVITTTITTLSPSVITTTESSTTTDSSSTTDTITSSDSTTTTSTSTTTTSFDNAPQYTGNPFHIESNYGTLGAGDEEDGTGRSPLLFNLRTEFTLNGFGNVMFFGGSDVWYTLTGGNNQVYTSDAPATGAKFRRQSNQQAVTCRVARNGVMFCNGAGGDVFYTDGTELYLGDAVPAGFFPVTLIAVLDDLSSTTTGTGTGTGTVLPTAVITQAPYWGNWGSGAIPSGVPVALTTCVTLPGPSGPITSTITVTSLHCGCTETPVPTSIAMTTYVTTCPESWGYTAPVTVTVPVTVTENAWNTWNGAVPTGAKGGSNAGPYAGGNSGSGGTTGGATGGSGYKPAGTNGTSWTPTYKGSASMMGVSSAALALSAAVLAMFL